MKNHNFQRRRLLCGFAALIALLALSAFLLHSKSGPEAAASQVSNTQRDHPGDSTLGHELPVVHLAEPKIQAKTLPSASAGSGNSLNIRWLSLGGSTAVLSRSTVEVYVGNGSKPAPTSPRTLATFRAKRDTTRIKAAATALEIWSGDVGNATDATWFLMIDDFVIHSGRLRLENGENELLLDPSSLETIELQIVPPKGMDAGGGTATLVAWFGHEFIELPADCPSSGRLEFGPLPPDCTYQMQVKLPGCVSTTSDVLCFRPGLRVMKCAIQPARAGGINGTIASKAGQPVPNCKVSVQSPGRVFSCTTDDAGSFHIDGLPMNDTRLFVSAPGYPGTCLSVPKESLDSAMEIRLEDGWSVIGSIVDARGNPLAGEPIHGAVHPHADDDVWHSSQSAESRSDGSFEIGPFATGDVVEITDVRSGISCPVRQTEFCKLVRPELQMADLELELINAASGSSVSGDALVKIECGRLSTASRQLTIRSGGLVRARYLREEGAMPVAKVSVRGFATQVVPVIDQDEGRMTVHLAPLASDSGVKCVDSDGLGVAGAVIRMSWPTSDTPVEFLVSEENIQRRRSNGGESVITLGTDAKGMVVPWEAFPGSAAYTVFAAGRYPWRGILGDSSGDIRTLILTEAHNYEMP